MSQQPRERGRVVASHHIARAAFLAALAFALVAVGWSIHVLVSGGSWWGPLHAFLAGTVVLAISGASQMFTITWSSTVPPPRIQVVTQRWLIVAGVGAVLVGVTFDMPLLVWAGGAGAVAGMLLLASVIYVAVRKSLLRRFDLSARFYLAAFAAGALGIGLGTVMGAEIGPSPDVRLVHVHLNLVGLVGLTIIGTIPTLLPTTAYSGAVSGREALFAWWLSLAGTISIGLGLWIPELVGSGTILVALAGMLILSGILWRLWEKGRHRLPFLQIAIGTVWLLNWGLIDGARVAIDGSMSRFSGWTAAAVLAGVGQVLAGSLAYLVPVLRGSPFGANRHIVEQRAWLPLLAANGAGVALGLGYFQVAVVVLSVWVADFAIRLARVAAGRTVSGGSD